MKETPEERKRDPTLIGKEKVYKKRQGRRSNCTLNLSELESITYDAQGISTK